MKQAIILALLTGCLGVAFYFVTTKTRDATQKHAYDNIIEAHQTPHWRASVVNGILGSEMARKDLKLTDEQTKELDELLVRRSETSKRLWEDWRTNNPDTKFPRPFQADGTKELAIETCQNAKALLTSQQRNRLEQLELQTMGWDFIYLKSVRRQLSITPRQITEFKDLKLEEIKLRSEFRRKTKAESSPEELQEIRDKMENLKNRFLKVLSKAQRKKRDVILGSPMSGHE